MGADPLDFRAGGTAMEGHPDDLRGLTTTGAGHGGALGGGLDGLEVHLSAPFTVGSGFFSELCLTHGEGQSEIDNSAGFNGSSAELLPVWLTSLDLATTRDRAKLPEGLDEPGDPQQRAVALDFIRERGLRTLLALESTTYPDDLVEETSPIVLRVELAEADRDRIVQEWITASRTAATNAVFLPLEVFHG